MKKYNKYNPIQPNNYKKFTVFVPDTICRACGSEFEALSLCQFCNEIIKYTCMTCGFISDEKIHADCRTAEFLITHQNQ